MRLFQKIIALFFALTIVLCTIGISFFVNICDCNSKVEICFVKKEISCCSNIETEAFAEEITGEFISNPICCTDFFLFYKLPITNVLSYSFNKTPVSSLVLVDNPFSNRTIDFFTNKVYIYTIINPPLQYFGRFLIQFLHSFKIHFPAL